MGKGDKKTAKGKRIIGSYGNVRKRKSSTTAAVVTKDKAEKPASQKKQVQRRKQPQRKLQAKLNKLSNDGFFLFIKFHSS
jgi:ribosomal small subunit protein bTHX